MQGRNLPVSTLGTLPRHMQRAAFLAGFVDSIQTSGTYYYHEFIVSFIVDFKGKQSDC
jgi:hypothetical protein